MYSFHVYEADVCVNVLSLITLTSVDIICKNKVILRNVFNTIINNQLGIK